MQLSSLKREIAETFSKGRELMESVTPEALNRKPADGGWSAAECLAHLNTTNEKYARAISTAIANAVPGPELDFQLGWFERWFVKQLEPPVKRRFRAPAVFQPDSNIRSAEVKREWNDLETRLSAAVDQAEKVNVKKTKVRSPVSKWLRFSLGAAFAIIAAHNRRHLWQATRAAGLRS